MKVLYIIYNTYTCAKLQFLYLSCTEMLLVFKFRIPVEPPHPPPVLTWADGTFQLKRGWDRSGAAHVSAGGREAGAHCERLCFLRCRSFDFKVFFSNCGCLIIPVIRLFISSVKHSQHSSHKHQYLILLVFWWWCHQLPFYIVIYKSDLFFLSWSWLEVFRHTKHFNTPPPPPPPHTPHTLSHCAASQQAPCWCFLENRCAVSSSMSHLIL